MAQLGQNVSLPTPLKDAADVLGGTAGSDYTPSGISVELDPIFSVSPAGSITAQDVLAWDTAYGWGNHTGLYSLLAHTHAGVYQPAGTYSTDIHSNISALNLVSGTNTGDNAVNSLYSGLITFPGFGTTVTTAAYGNHLHTGVYQAAGTYSTDIHSNISALNLVSGTNTGDNAVNSLYSGLVTFPGFGTTVSTAAYGNHLHSGTYEPALGNPGVNGYVLASTTGGLRSWVLMSGGGTGIGYPPSSGIPIVVGGSAWGTTITDNSINWNTAYGWGNHSGLYSLVGHNHTGVYLPVAGTAADSTRLNGQLASYYQTAIGYTTENVANKVTSMSGASTNTEYPSALAVHNELDKKQGLNTGFLSGMVLSINADPTKFDVSAGYYVVSDYSDAIHPVGTIIAYPGSTGNTPAYLTTDNATYVAVNSLGVLVYSNMPFTDSDRRAYATIGALIHSNRTTINVTNEIKAPITATTNQLHDVIRAVGGLNLSGNVYGPISSNLTIRKTEGVIFGLGINSADYTDPHQLTIANQNSVSFRYRLQTGTEYADTTVINPNSYDNAGVLTAVTAGKFTIQHITLFQSGLTRIQYGQFMYDNISTAMLNLRTEMFVVEANIADNAIMRCYLVVQQGVTDLTAAVASNAARFVPVDKFGSPIGGVGSALESAAIVAALGYTPENVANKENVTINTSTSKYPTINLLRTGLNILPGDIGVYGFLNQAETTIAFDGVKIFTLGSVGASWSYYRAGLKYTITGSKTIDLTTVDAVLVNGAKYYIYIDAIDGTLSASRTVWSLVDTKVPVAVISWNNTLTPKYMLQEERHSCAMLRREHLYLHSTRGTQYITGGNLTGFTPLTTTDAANTFAIAQSQIADEDIYLTLALLADGDGLVATNYTVSYRTSASTWAWAYSDMPFSYTAAGYINWDNAGTLTQGTGGAGGAIRYYNTYLLFTNTQGDGRHIIVVGQNEHLTTTSAYSESFATFSLEGFPKAEWVAVYQMTWETGAAGLTNKGKVRLARAPQRIITSSITASSTSTAAHNLLSGLQGGTGGEYYHLTYLESQGDYGVKTLTASKFYANGEDSSQDIFRGQSTVAGYIEAVLHNASNGTTAQSGFALEADNGSLTTNYAWLGINSSGYTDVNYANNTGFANDVVLFAKASDFYIGNAIALKKIKFLTGGLDPATNLRMFIDASGNVNVSSLTASKLVFTDASKNLTSTGIGTSAQFIKGDGSLDSNTYQAVLTNPVTGTGTSGYLAKWNGASTINASGVAYSTGTSLILGTTTDNNGKLQIYDASSSIAKLIGGTSQLVFTSTSGVGNYTMAYGAGFIVGTSDAYNLYLSTTNTSRLEVGPTGNFDFNGGQLKLIQSTGFFGVGYSSDPSSGNKLAVNGAAYFNGAIRSSTIKLVTGATVDYVWKCTNIDGSGAWAASTGGSTWTVSVISTNTNAVKNYIYVLTASLVLTLPATPSAGDSVKVSNMSGTITASIARNGSNIMGLAEDVALNKLNAGLELVYADATRGWIII